MTAETLTQETESQFFVIRTAQDVADAFKARIDNYKGKLDDYKGKLDDYNEKYFKKAAEKGKAFKDGVVSDVSLLKDRVFEKGKAVAPEEIPGMKKVEDGMKKAEEKFTSVFKTLVEKMELPTRKDIEELNSDLDILKTRVNALDSRYSG